MCVLETSPLYILETGRKQLYLLFVDQKCRPTLATRFGWPGARGASFVMCAAYATYFILRLELGSSWESQTSRDATEQIICLRKIGPPQGEEHEVRGGRSTVEEKHARRKPQSTVREKKPDAEPDLALFGLFRC